MLFILAAVAVLGYGRKTTLSIEQCLLNARDGITTKPTMNCTIFTQLNNMNLSMSILRRNSKVAYDIIKTIIAGLACYALYELTLLV